jgi:hypothetical protein
MELRCNGQVLSMWCWSVVIPTLGECCVLIDHARTRLTCDIYALADLISCSRPEKLVQA